MAKQKGPIKIIGNIDDINFYRSKGKMFARLASSLSRDQIMNDPRFRRTRENMKEFGARALAAKSLRKALENVNIIFKDNNAHNRRFQLMTEIMKNGSAGAIRGQTPIQFLLNKDLLKGYNLNSNNQLDLVLPVPLQVSSTAARNEATLTVPDFDTDMLRAADEVKAFRLYLAIGTLGDHVYDPVKGQYVINDADYSGLSAYVTSAPIPLQGMVGSPTTLTVQLAGSPAIPATTALIAACGIEFLLESGSGHVALQDLKSMAIIDVF